ncbi:MAG: glycosyltransferase [Pirellulales bacterium]|nr:glycosyltransferase [Pirellulales bacterium]
MTRGVAASRELLVFADDWGRHPSSCQHLVKRLQPHYRILWANTIGTRSPKADRFTLRRGVEKLNSWRHGLRQVADSMWVVDLPMLPKIGHPLARGASRQLVTWRLRQVFRQIDMSRPTVLTTLPFVQSLIRGLPRAGLVYYCTDDYSQWPGAEREALANMERETATAANLILAVSRPLEARLRSLARCEYFPHGVDCGHFALAQSATIAPAIAALPQPRIGFFGLIYEKLDFGLLSAVARANPEGSLCMIGRVDHCPESFRSISNVHFLEAQPYADLPEWLAGLDVLLLPYVDDEMIRQSCPLKLRECLASGKPTVSVSVAEVNRFVPHVRVGEDHEAFVAAVRQSLSESPDEGGARQAAVADDDWDKKAGQLRHQLDAIAAAAR